MNAEKKLVQYLGELNSVPVVSKVKPKKQKTVKLDEEIKKDINANPWFDILNKKY